MHKTIILGLLFCIVWIIQSHPLSAQRKNKKNKTPKQNSSYTETTSASKEEQVKYYYYEAMAKRTAGDYQGSIYLLKEVLKLDPQHHASLFLIADLNFELKNYPEAEPYAEKAIQLDNQNVWYFKLLALIYERNQKLEKAIQLLEKNIERFRDEVDIHLELADLYVRNTQYAKAIALYDTIENRLGVTEEISIQKQRIYLLLNQPEKAAQEIQKLIDLHPYEPKHYHALYDLYTQMKQKELAIQTLEKLLTVNPDETLALFKIADYYHTQKNETKEMLYLKRAFSNPNISIELKTEYLMNRLSQDTSQANKNKLLELASYIPTNENQSIYFAIKADLIASQRPDSARYYYQKALQSNPQNQLLWNKILELDTKSEKPDLLLQDAQQAVENFPNEPVFLYYLGFANYQLQKYSNTIKNFEKLLKFMDNSEEEMVFDVYEMLANAYHYEKNYKKSDETFEKLLQFDPDNPITLNNYAYFLAERGEKLEKALQMIEGVIKTNPNEPSFQDTYGWILFKMNRYDEALQWVEKAYHTEKSPDICEHLGDIYFKKGNKTKAIELWNEAQKLGGNSPNLLKKIQSGSL